MIKPSIKQRIIVSLFSIVSIICLSTCGVVINESNDENDTPEESGQITVIYSYAGQGPVDESYPIIVRVYNDSASIEKILSDSQGEALINSIPVGEFDLIVYYDSNGDNSFNNGEEPGASTPSSFSVTANSSLAFTVYFDDGNTTMPGAIDDPVEQDQNPGQNLSSDKALSSFSFLEANNSQYISIDVIGTIDEDAKTITCVFPSGFSVSQSPLIANFETSADKIKFSGTELESGVTSVYYNVQPKELHASAEDLTSAIYNLKFYLTPVANAGDDITVAKNEIFTLDGLGIPSNDNSIDKYYWDFNNADGISQDATGDPVYHSYPNEGEYTVSLTVVDDLGISSSDTLTVSVLKGFDSVPQNENYYIYKMIEKDGVLYMAGKSNTDEKLTVRKSNDWGTTWNTIGGPNFTEAGVHTGSSSNSNNKAVSLVVESDGDPVVAYQDEDAYYISIMKYTGNVTDDDDATHNDGWEYVGIRNAISNGFGVSFPYLMIDDFNNLYIGYNHGGYAKAKQFIVDSWEHMGKDDATTDGKIFSCGPVGNDSVVFAMDNNSDIYLAAYASSIGLRILKHTGNLTETDGTYNDGWEYVGDEIFESDDDLYPSDIIFDSANTMWIAYMKLDTNSGYKAYIKKLSGPTWETVGNAFTHKNIWRMNLNFNQSEAPYAIYSAYNDGAGHTGDQAISIMTYTGETVNDIDGVENDGWELIFKPEIINCGFSRFGILFNDTSTPYFYIDKSFLKYQD